jgi:hypothetical protein
MADKQSANPPPSVIAGQAKAVFFGPHKLDLQTGRRTTIRPGWSRLQTAPMTWRDLFLPPAIATTLSLWFDAVFRGVRKAASLMEQGQFVRARMIVRRISAILRHDFVLLAVRVEVKLRHGAAAPSPPATPQTESGGGGAAAPTFPLWASVPFSGRHQVSDSSASFFAGRALRMASARTTPKTSERDYWEERVAAAEEARFALCEFWRRRRDSS